MHAYLHIDPEGYSINLPFLQNTGKNESLLAVAREKFWSCFDIQTPTHLKKIALKPKKIFGGEAKAGAVSENSARHKFCLKGNKY